MNPLLEQFLSETRDVLEQISEQLLEVEKHDDRNDTLNELFRLVHTLKGNTGLFEFPDLTRVLHAAEDLMSYLREHPSLWQHSLTDILFDSMDFVSQFCDEVEQNGGEPGNNKDTADRLEHELRTILKQLDEGNYSTDDGNTNSLQTTPEIVEQAESIEEPPAADPEAELMQANQEANSSLDTNNQDISGQNTADHDTPPRAGEEAATTPEVNLADDDPDRILPEPPDGERVAALPEEALLDAWRRSQSGSGIIFVNYQPVPDCFFQGDDPLFTARQAPDVVWGNVTVKDSANTIIEEADPFQCDSTLQFISVASTEEIQDHFRYVPDQVEITEVNPLELLQLRGEDAEDAIDDQALEDLCQAIYANKRQLVVDTAHALLELCANDLKAASALRWLIRIDADATEPHHAMVVIAQHLRQCLGAEPMQFVSLTAEEVETSHEVHEQEAAAEAAKEQQALELSQAVQTIAQEDEDALHHMLAIQYRIIAFTDSPSWANGRVRSACTMIRRAYTTLHLLSEFSELESLCDAAESGDKQPLLDWIEKQLPRRWHEMAGLVESKDNESSAFDADKVESSQLADTNSPSEDTSLAPSFETETSDTEASSAKSSDDAVVDNASTATTSASSDTATASAESGQKTAAKEEPRPAPVSPVKPAANKVDKAGRAEIDAEVKASSSIGTSRSVKVDQEKIDRLMNLIGEMIVAKNSLPFLAKRAEEQYGLRELGREIKEQYAVVNRIAEEMQDSIMQIRMMPFSFITMRFPRLVRDISRRLGKEVQLVVEGEDTEADKNIIESLAEPLIHIVRNSLDHGIEMPDVRRNAGKPASGTLTIRASQEADRVLIEILDDGKGIDPEVIKQKALEKGLIDDATAGRMSDREAVNLVLLPGFSTAEEVSDLSGRGVGMDAVRSAVEKVNGAMSLDSEAGRGTHIRISLPMSIAVTRVMIVESDGQLMGVPMDQVLETVRVHKDNVYVVKHVQTTVLRDRIVPLKSLNNLLALPSEPEINEEGEYAVLVARVGNDVLGLLVDDFRGSVDIIQKPMAGVMSSLSAYSGAALIGDGSVLMVLNLKEVL